MLTNSLHGWIGPQPVPPACAVATRALPAGAIGRRSYHFPALLPLCLRAPVGRRTSPARSIKWKMPQLLPPLQLVGCFQPGTTTIPRPAPPSFGAPKGTVEVLVTRTLPGRCIGRNYRIDGAARVHSISMERASVFKTVCVHLSKSSYHKEM